MRDMVRNGREVYRVVVRKQKRERNPDYVQGKGLPYWILVDGEEVEQHGPYNHLGAAKGVLTRETVDTWKEDGSLKWGVLGGWIEKATTTWEKVDLG